MTLKKYIARRIRKLKKLRKEFKKKSAKKISSKLSVKLYSKESKVTVGGITSWGGFIINGWVDTNFTSLGHISIMCEDEIMECCVCEVPLRIRKSSQNHKNRVGFQLQLPGYLWEDVDGSEVLDIRICLSEEVLHTEPLKLDFQKACGWMSDISSVDGQFLSLLALEHLHFFKGRDQLKRSVKDYFISFSELMGMSAYVPWRDTLATTKVNGENASNSAEKKAQNLINERLRNKSTDVLEHLFSVVDELSLSESSKQGLFYSVIPLLCRDNLFVSFYETNSGMNTLELRESKDNWKRSISLAFIAVEQDIEELKNTLQLLADCKSDSWLSTECVKFSCLHTKYLAQTLAIEQSAAEGVYRAFLSLLDSFQGDWFSRLHDQMLIETMTSLLDDMSTASSRLQRELINASLRHYGLSPVFWTTIERSTSSIVWCDPLFIKAYENWKHISAGLSKLPKSLDLIHEALNFYIERDNPEATVFLREVLSNSLPTAVDQVPVWQQAFDDLVKRAPLESLRVTANPQGLIDVADSRYIQVQVFDGLRQQQRGYDLVYHLQIKASECLNRFNNALGLENEHCLELIIDELIDYGEQLNSEGGAFLGLDLWAYSCTRLVAESRDVQKIYEVLDEALRAHCQRRAAGDESPPTLYSCLSRLSSSILENDIEAGLIYQKVRKNLSTQQLNVVTPHKEGSCLTVVSSLWQDTIVVIYSCRKYLDSRVEAIRETWLKDLQRRGIPYVILIGGGENKLEGDILALDVPDSYEDLPQKTLKLFEWMLEHTSAQYVFKIDDDCYLDVDRYFDTLTYRKHHYYGRILQRSVGSTNRAWHQDKSQSLSVRKRIDKSPEPSIYTDGGGGYSLSRLAISYLIKNSTTAHGRHLIASSFMEDKLVGDLLSISGILPSDEDYDCYQRRRTYPDATPVGMWENTFFPSEITPTKVVHLDTERDQKRVHRWKNMHGYWPKKIWPSYENISVQLNSNQLELLTPEESTVNLLREDIFVISVIRNERVMLPHFLAHYRSIGVRCFIVVDNCSDDGSREYLLEQPDVLLYSADAEYKYSHYGVAWQQTILGNHCLNKWALVADADEFLIYPKCEELPLEEYLKIIEKDDIDCVRTDMIDMYPDGNLADADFKKSKPFEVSNYFDGESSLNPWRLSRGAFSNNISYLSSLRHRLDSDAEPHAFTAQKYALIKYKPWMRFSQGLHDATGVRVAKEAIHYAHFKYHAGFKDKVITEVARGQHYDEAKEYRRYLATLEEVIGDFKINGISTEYTSSRSFSEI